MAHVRSNPVVLNTFLSICHQMACLGFQLHSNSAPFDVGFPLRHMI